MKSTILQSGVTSLLRALLGLLGALCLQSGPSGSVAGRNLSCTVSPRRLLPAAASPWRVGGPSEEESDEI